MIFHNFTATFFVHSTEEVEYLTHCFLPVRGEREWFCLPCTFCREPPEVCPALPVEVALLYIYNATEVFVEHWILFMSWRKRNTVIRLESRDSTVRAKSFQSCLTVTLCTVAHQASLLMGFSRQEYCSGLPCPPPEDLPHPRIEPVSLTSPALAGGFFTANTIWGLLVTD